MKIAVIGEGKMGSNIFYYLDKFDFPLIWLCSSREIADTIQATYHKRLQRAFKNSLIDEQLYNSKLNNNLITSDIQKLANYDLIIEAIWEDKEKKHQLFSELDSIVNSDCIFASNSSSIIPSKLYPSETRKDRIIGLHFFYPVELKNIVEFIITNHTNELVKTSVIDLLNKINKKYLLLPEENGFILNKYFLEIQAEAFNICLENILTIQEIDELVKQEFFPIGVFEMFDHVGIDIMLTSITEYISGSASKQSYEPLLNTLAFLLENNCLGIKNKQGFYIYQGNVIEINPILSSFLKSIFRKVRIDNVDNYKLSIKSRLLNTMIVNANNIVDKGICTKSELNYAIKEYLGADKGPFDY